MDREESHLVSFASCEEIESRAVDDSVRLAMRLLPEPR